VKVRDGGVGETGEVRVDGCDREVGGSDADVTGMFPVTDVVGTEGRWAVEIGEVFIVVAIGEDSKLGPKFKRLSGIARQSTK